MPALRKTVVRFLPLLLVFGAWEALTAPRLIPEDFIPRFAHVLRALGDLLSSAEFYGHAGASFSRAFFGLTISIVAGVALGIGMAWYRWVKRFCEPLVVLSYPIPKPAIIPVFIIWLGIGDLSKIAVIALGCVVPIIISSYNATLSVDRYLVWSALSKGTSERQLLRKVIFPASLPRIAVAIRVAIAVAFLLLVSSEFIAANTGLGYLTFSYGSVGANDYMFATIFLIVAVGFSADRGYAAAMQRVLAWHEFGEL